MSNGPEMSHYVVHSFSIYLFICFLLKKNIAILEVPSAPKLKCRYLILTKKEKKKECISLIISQSI